MTEDLTPKRERTRRAILDAAYTLFVEQGYAATSMRQIADAAGIALGGIYNHYASKDEIFSAIVAERHPYYQVMPMLLEAEGKTFEEFARDAARRLIDALGHRPDLLNLMLIEIVEFKGQHVPELFKIMYPNMMQLAERFKRFEGQVRDDMPPPLMLRAFLGMFFSYYITELMLTGLMPDAMQQKSLDAFVDIFLHGISSKA